jgi:hypothetical protein
LRVGNFGECTAESVGPCADDSAPVRDRTRLRDVRFAPGSVVPGGDVDNEAGAGSYRATHGAEYGGSLSADCAAMGSDGHDDLTDALLWALRKARAERPQPPASVLSRWRYRLPAVAAFGTYWIPRAARDARYRTRVSGCSFRSA